MSINKRRAKAAKKAIIGMSDDARRDLRSGIVDMLANIRHLCDAKGIDFGNADEMAYMHYCEEKHDARREEQEPTH